MVLAVIVAAGYFYKERPSDGGPRPFRTTVTLSVPSPVPEEGASSDADVTEVPDVLFRGQQALALSQDTRDAALAAAPPGDANVGFSATVDDDQIVLTVSSEDREVSQAVAGAYAAAFSQARRDLVGDDLANQQRALLETIEQLRTRLQTTEAELRARFAELPPVVAPQPEDEDASAPFVVPFTPDQNLDSILLLYERNSLYSRINDAQFELAELRVDAETPGSFAVIIGENTSQAAAEQTASLLGPLVGILVAGLVLGLGSALLLDRMDHTIRHADRAARALSAPLLSRIPSRRGRRGEATVLLHPDSPRTEAFRDLAATCVATDRLPRAIMVTTPRGDVHDDVAANFAAALADLGVRVALVATSPRQSWYLAPFEVEDSPRATLPELLGEAHAGHLNGQVRGRLARTDRNPNLVVLAPGDDPDLSVALDGLPPLLQAMVDSEIDVTVIAGPALLDDSSATIVAWATRAVLWAIQAGEITQEEASTGAARLELAGVTAFGVAVVGAES